MKAAGTQVEGNRPRETTESARCEVWMAQAKGLVSRLCGRAEAGPIDR